VRDRSKPCERCEDLEWQIRELKKQLAPDVDIPSAWGLTSMERAVFRLLSRSEWVSYERLDALRPREDRVYSTDVMKVHVCKLRRKLRSCGGPEIETKWGVGYRLVDLREVRDAA